MLSVAGVDDSTVDDRAPIGKTGPELREVEEDAGQVTRRFILPPYVEEETANTRFKAVLPFFYFKERMGDGARKDVGILPFYWRADGEEMNARVYFPFYWRFRARTFDADVVLNTYVKRSENAHAFGVAPFFFSGADKDKKSSYQVILPPLFWNFSDPDGGTTVATLFYNHRDKDDFSRGFVPVYFSRKKHDKTVTTVLPPLFWNVKDAVQFTNTTVLPPFFFKNRKTGFSVGLLPLLYFARDETWSRNMVMPFYYGSAVGEKRRHVFPILASYVSRGPSGYRQGGAAVFYHWYRKDGAYLDMVSPLFWRWGNTRTREKNVLIPPLMYRGSSPVADRTMALMLYWNFHDHGLKKTVSLAPLFVRQKKWENNERRLAVFPGFDFGKSDDGWHARLHPLLYFGRHRDRTHQVIAPLWWQFDSPKKKSTVVFPVYWQFKHKLHSRVSRVVFPLYWQIDDNKRNDTRRVVFPLFWDFHNQPENRRSTLIAPPLFWKFDRTDRRTAGVGNIGVQKGTKDEQDYWTFNLFPLLLFGKPPAEQGVRWELLHGLVGWTRSDEVRVFKLFWIPFSNKRRLKNQTEATAVP